MFNIGPMELIVILLVALIIVGPKRLPEVGRTIGKSLREFRKAQDEVRSSLQFNLDDDEPSPRHVQTPKEVEPAPSPDGEAASPDEGSEPAPPTTPTEAD